MAAEPQAHQKHPWEVFVDHLSTMTLTEENHKLFTLPRTGITLSCMSNVGDSVPAEIYIYVHDTYGGRDGMRKIFVAAKIVDSQVSAWTFLNAAEPPKFLCVMPLGNFAAGKWYPLPRIRSGSHGGIVAEYTAFLDSLDCWSTPPTTPEASNGS